MEEWQRLHIEKNIDRLIKLTTVHIQFLSMLRKADILSQMDVDMLEIKGTPMDRAYALYTTVASRQNAYEPLKSALDQTKQSGALAILCEKPKSYENYGSIAINRKLVIGKGCYNTKICKGIFGGRDVAVKVFNQEDVSFELIKNEVDCLKKLDYHPNIVRYFTAETKGDYVYIALEFCVCNLQEWVKQRNVNILEGEILLQTTQGLRHLHDNKFLHRDLKPANILLSDKSQVKISDFGMSKRIPNEATSVTVHSMGNGTEGWMAPEVYNFGLLEGPELKLKPATDIFSLGCIFYYVLTGGLHPFGLYWQRQAYIIENRPIFDAHADHIKHLPVDCMTLIKMMISKEPERRPSAGDILRSSYIMNMKAGQKNMEMEASLTSKPNQVAPAGQTKSAMQQEIKKEIPKSDLDDDYNKNDTEELPVQHENIEGKESEEDSITSTINKLVLVEEFPQHEIEKIPIKNNDIFGTQMEMLMVYKGKKIYLEEMLKVFHRNTLGHISDEELGKLDMKLGSELTSFIETKVRSLNDGQLEKLRIQQTKMFLHFKEINNVKKNRHNNRRGQAVGIYLGSTHCRLEWIYFSDDGKGKRGYNCKRCGVPLEQDAEPENQEVQLGEYPKETVFDVKGFLGQRIKDKNYLGKVAGKPFPENCPPELVLAEILKQFVSQSEREWKTEIKSAVITAPTYFTDSQRKCIYEGGKLAGIFILDILHESMAAALAYDLKWQAFIRPRKALIYHLGSKSTDVTILEMYQDEVTILGEDVDMNLGGREIDMEIMRHCVAAFNKQSGTDFCQQSTSRQVLDLQKICENAKRSLSQYYSSTTNGFDIIIPGSEFVIHLDRNKFDGVIMKLFEKTTNVVVKALQMAKVNKDELDDVILTGGNTSITKIQEMLKNFFPMANIHGEREGDMVVAHGAAWQAQLLNYNPDAKKMFKINHIIN